MTKRGTVVGLGLAALVAGVLLLRAPRPDGHTHVGATPEQPDRANSPVEISLDEPTSRELAERPADAEVEVEVPVEPAFFLRVLRAPENAAVEEVAFRTTAARGSSLARALSGDARTPRTTVRSHGGGLFELSIRTGRPLAICAVVPGCSPRALFVERGAARPEDAPTIVLERSSGISVRLTGDPGTRLDGARIRARTAVRGLLVGVPDSEPPDPAEASWWSGTDASGRAELAGLPGRVPLDVSVERDGACLHRRAEPIVLEPGEVRELELVLGAASVVHGRMIDEHDAPLPGREVWLVEVDPRFLDAFDAGTRPLERATTGPDGTFRFDAVREGRWRIGAAYVPRDAAGDEEPIRAEVVVIDVGARSERIEVTLRALRGSFVSGVVLDEEERPVANCVVHVDPSSASRTWTRSDARGEFRIGPLESGVHQLVAGSAGAGKWSESPPLDVLAGTRGVVLRVSFGAALRGRLVDADGREQAEGRIEVTQVEGGEMAAAWAMTVNRARFDLAGLAAGTYDVFAVARGARACSARVELRAGEQRELELRLEAGATLALENQTNEDLTVELRAAGRLVGLHPLARAASQRWTVPAGALEVSTRDGEQRRLATQALELRPGEERTLVLRPR